MKHSLLIGLPLVLSACGGYTGYSNQWLGSDPSAGPTHVAGSAENTTNAFDGEYRDLSVQNNSKNNTLPIMGASATLKCQSYTGNEFPPLTVTNGLARFEAMGIHFAGYVTPQGHLRMTSGYGATVSGNLKEVPVDEDFDGDFDTVTHTLHGQVIGACAYKAAWQRAT
jgi:hypothetical protein